jgi:serine/threonine-protein kinase TTK/MPS1
VWSLGCILYAMVYGKTPFEHYGHLLGRLRAIADPSVQIAFPAIPDASLLDVLRACLRRDPHERPTIPELLDHAFLRPPSQPAPQSAQRPAQTGGGGAAAAPVSVDQVRSLIEQLSEQMAQQRVARAAGAEQRGADANAATTQQLTELLAQLLSTQQQLEGAPPLPPREVPRTPLCATPQPRMSSPRARAPPLPPPAPPPPSAAELRSRVASLHHSASADGASSSAARPSAAPCDFQRELVEKQQARMQRASLAHDAQRPALRTPQPAELPARVQSFISSGSEMVQRAHDAQRARGELSRESDDTALSDWA